MLAVPEFLVRLADAALPVMVDAWVKGAVILAAAWGATRLMRRASAAARHLVWTVGFAGLLALPVLSLVVPAWRVPVPAAMRPLVPRAALPAEEPSASADVRGAPAPEELAALVETLSATVAAPAGTAAPEPAAHGPHPEAVVTHLPAMDRLEATVTMEGPSAAALTATSTVWLVGYWLAGAAVILAGLLRGRWQVSRMGQRAQRVRGAAWIELAQSVADRLGIRRPITLLRSADAGVPVTWGAVYPVVLLPGDADGWTPERRSAVLVHEMAHVTRFDVVTQLLGQLATALHWPNPLAWIALRHLRNERERACDDYVLSTGTAAASAYAGDLLELVRSLGSADRPALAALAMAHRSQFEGRLLAILDPAVSRRGVSRRTGLATVAAALALILPLAAMRPATPAPDDAHSGMDVLGRLMPTAELYTPAPAVAIRTDTVFVARATLSGSEPAGLGAPVAVSAAPLAASPFPEHAATAEMISSTTTGSGGGCRLGNGRSRRGTGSQSMMSRHENDGSCFVVTSSGRISFTSDESDVESIEAGGFLTIVEQRRPGGVTRRLDFDPDGRGGVERRYWVDDEERELDDEGRRWLASVLPNVVRESAEPGPRAARILARGGPDAVLDEARQIASDETKAGYFAALFKAAGGDRRLLERITEQLGRTIASDGTKARLLAELSKLSGGDAAAQADIVEASETIASDSERRRLLSGLAGEGASRDLLVRVARSAAHIASDNEKGELLLQMANRYVDDDELRRELIRLTQTIASDETKGRVLLALLERGTLTPRARVEFLGVTNTIASDTKKQSVLVRFASTDSLEDAALRRAFFSAARSIASDNSKQQVLTSVLKRRPSPAVVAECLKAAGTIASDHSKANVLLAAVAAGPLDEPLRELLLDVAETLGSDSEFRRVSSAVMR